MGRRETKGQGLSYQMRAFEGARRAPGLSELDIAKLRSQGTIQALAPVPDPEGEAAAGSTAEASPEHERPTDDEGPGEGEGESGSSGRRSAAKGDRRSARRGRAEPKAPAKGGRSTPKRARATPSYVLETSQTSGSRRSHHFRLPAEIEGYLGELAKAHGCTRTHVVCAALEAEWRRFRRRRQRGQGAADE